MTIPALQHDEPWARRITERIRVTGITVKENLARLQDLLTEAREGGAAELLGYQSWTAYVAALFAEEPLRLPRDQRQELVGYLAGEGMSTRAIAPIVGVGDSTVQRDLAGAPNGAGVQNWTSDTQVVPEVPPEPEPVAEPLDHQTKSDFVRDALRAAEQTGNVVQLTGQPVRSVTGLDGKTYTKPAAPAEPRRKPIPDQFFTAAYDMGKAIERVHRLTTDDRYPQNAEKVAAKHRNDLLRSQDLLQQVIDSLPTQGV